MIANVCPKCGEDVVYLAHCRRHGYVEAVKPARGATGVSYQFGAGGRIDALMFLLPVQKGTVQFSLPVNWKLFQVVLKEQKVRGWQDEHYVYRVAWRCLRDWVLAQLALYETAMVELPQVFLPFAQGHDGRTLYESAKSSQFLLGEGK